MSADFWAGYLSGVVGILVGNPLDIVKVRLQTRQPSNPVQPSDQVIRSAIIYNASPTDSARHGPRSVLYPQFISRSTTFATGAAAPILGYGALNALLFVSYNRAKSVIDTTLGTNGNFWEIWLAGALGGLATWVVSTPTELIKCRAQLASPPTSSWSITTQIWRGHGLRGLYFGGTVTALRDSIGYGFYFWSYELGTRWMASESGHGVSPYLEATKVLFCGGLAGIVTWASVFPLDVIKTRMQTQPLDVPLRENPQPSSALLGNQADGRRARLGTLKIAEMAYREGGFGVFFRGLTVCSVRAFCVNAVQWAVYEWVMHKLGEGRKEKGLSDVSDPVMSI